MSFPNCRNNYVSRTLNHAAPVWSSEGVVDMPLNNIAVDPVKTTMFERRFEPYDFNGGCVIFVIFRFILPRTTVVIAGEDFAIAAGCTRLSTGYEILSRNQSKLAELFVLFVLICRLILFRTGQTVLASAGCLTDIITLRNVLAARITQYVQTI